MAATSPWSMPLISVPLFAAACMFEPELKSYGLRLCASVLPASDEATTHDPSPVLSSSAAAIVRGAITRAPNSCQSGLSTMVSRSPISRLGITVVLYSPTSQPILPLESIRSGVLESDHATLLHQPLPTDMITWPSGAPSGNPTLPRSILPAPESSEVDQAATE